MQIPLFSVYSPSGENEYLLTTLNDTVCNALLGEAKRGAAELIGANLVSPFQGLTFRSQEVQVFSYISCTGWLLLVGFENGPFNGTEVECSPFCSILFP